MDIKQYEDLVWRNSRIFAKRLNEVRGDDVATKVIFIELSDVTQLTKNEIESVKEALNDELYRTDTMEWDDGPGLGQDVPFDDGVYERLKDAFRRVHEGEY